MSNGTAQRTIEFCIWINIFNTSHAKSVISVPGGHLMGEFFRPSRKNN